MRGGGGGGGCGGGYSSGGICMWCARVPCPCEQRLEGDVRCPPLSFSNFLLYFSLFFFFEVAVMVLVLLWRR